MLKLVWSLILLVFGTGVVRGGESLRLTIFAHDTVVPLPFTNHVWASVTRHQADGTLIDERTISWMPRGSWHLLDKAKPGYHLDMVGSLDFAVAITNPLQRRGPFAKIIRCWGPYEIDRATYDAFVAQADSLPEKASYKAIDGLSRKRTPPAVNCYHAVSDVAGKLKTNLRYGKWAADRIARHYEKAGMVRPAKDADLIYESLNLARWKVRRVR